jgi:hypothetical protein
MGLPQLLAHWFVTDKVAEFSERIAARSRQAAWQRVWQRLGTFGQAEARGYIRARVSAIVHEETDRLIEQEGSKAAKQRSRLIGSATDILVKQLVGQSQQARKMYAPTRKVA